MNLEPVVSTSIARTHRRRLWGRLGVGIILVTALVVALASLALAADWLPRRARIPPVLHRHHRSRLREASSAATTDGNFGPGDPVMRQQFAKMIVLTGAYPVSEANVCPFTDVESSGPGDTLSRQLRGRLRRQRHHAGQDRDHLRPLRLHHPLPGDQHGGARGRRSAAGSAGRSPGRLDGKRLGQPTPPTGPTPPGPSTTDCWTDSTLPPSAPAAT